MICGRTDVERFQQTEPLGISSTIGNTSALTIYYVFIRPYHQLPFLEQTWRYFSIRISWLIGDMWFVWVGRCTFDYYKVIHWLQMKKQNIHWFSLNLKDLTQCLIITNCLDPIRDVEKSSTRRLQSLHTIMGF